MTISGRDEQVLTGKDGLLGLIGISPIPIIGEIALSRLFYKPLEAGSNLSGPPLALATTIASIISRGFLYKLYMPIYERIADFYPVIEPSIDFLEKYTSIF